MGRSLHRRWTISERLGKTRNHAAKWGKTLANQEAALKDFKAKVKKKSAEGYQPVPFDDPRYGVPAFGAVGEGNAMSIQIWLHSSRIARCLSVSPAM